jgi:hypothetical protein
MNFCQIEKKKDYYELYIVIFINILVLFILMKEIENLLPIFPFGKIENIYYDD